MQFGLSEAALLISTVFAGYMCFPVGKFAFGRISSIWLGLLVWLTLIALVFLPSILVSAYAECNFRGYITLFGTFIGAITYRALSVYRLRGNDGH